MGISMEAYYGGVVAAIGKVVFVTINYRVGIFGFFDSQLEQHSELYPKNIGLYDQIAALEWVNKHIHFFGGKTSLVKCLVFTFVESRRCCFYYLARSVSWRHLNWSSHALIAKQRTVPQSNTSECQSHDAEANVLWLTL